MEIFHRFNKLKHSIRGCVIIHQITRNKRNVLAPRITHGLDGKRPVRSRNRICVIYSHADFYYDTFLCPTEKRLSKKICVICELKIGGRRESQICVTLIICGHVFMTRPHYIRKLIFSFPFSNIFSLKPWKLRGKIVSLQKKKLHSAN